MQPDGKILRPQLIARVRPDDGDTPFQLTSTGASEATPDIIAITTTETTTGKSIPYGETYSGKWYQYIMCCASLKNSNVENL